MKLSELLTSAAGIRADLAGQIVEFHRLLVDENQRQNLTRIVSEEDFYWKNVVDALQTVGVGALGKKNFEIGSGGGLPGLILAILEPERQFVLSESERAKAGFLSRAVDALGLINVTVVSERAEKAIAGSAPDVVFSRAVGSVDKLIGWIDQCSTWNTLVLYKGKGWAEEWSTSRSRKRGLIVREVPYLIPPGVERRIVLITRRDTE